jgi:hypothetical protein
VRYDVDFAARTVTYCGSNGEDTSKTTQRWISSEAAGSSAPKYFS